MTVEAAKGMSKTSSANHDVSNLVDSVNPVRKVVFVANLVEDCPAIIMPVFRKQRNHKRHV
jgi:hypothetical protein